jgi:hypothetical protein
MKRTHTECAWGIPYPKTAGSWETAPAEPVCICTPGNEDNMEYCPVCETYSDSCVACMPEPSCDCVYTDVDQTDAAGCQLHDPDSYYNFLVRQAGKKAAARRKPVGHEQVAEPFRSILNSIERSA